MFLNLIFGLIGIAFGIIAYFRSSFQHWKNKRLPYLQPSFPFGNMENPFNRTKSLGILIQSFYNEFKSRGCKHGGVYNFSSPIYVPVDPEYIKNIMQTNFDHFVDRGWYFNEKDDPLSAHLFAIEGKKWRKLRVKLTPTFTSGKMKTMFDTLVQCAEQMKIAVTASCDQKNSIDIKDIVARFTTDTIGSCAFGLDCNTFKNPDAAFRKQGKNVFAPHSKVKAILHIFCHAKPELANSLGIKLLNTEAADFFSSTIRETVKYRETNNFTRKDMLQLLIEQKNSILDENALTMDEIAAQAFVFFIAGFETSSTTMAFCLFELAQDQEMQEKVRHEINSILDEENLTYDSLIKMTYLGQVIEETMRKYPAIPYLSRRCVQNYKVPNTEVEIEKGTLVFLPVLGLHYDPEHYPDPEKFDPDRFSEENKKKIHPFAYLPFGAGPRLCIGVRFGIMQTKLGLVTLLRNFKMSLNSNTEVPLKINPFSLIHTSTGCIFLNVERI